MNLLIYNFWSVSQTLRFIFSLNIKASFYISYSKNMGKFSNHFLGPFFLFLNNKLYFFYYHLSPLYLPSPTITTLLSMSIFLNSLPSPFSGVVSLLSVYESISILLVSTVCSLDSTYEWHYMVFVFLWLANFP